jgi:Flp pilus assembly protein TadB
LKLEVGALTAQARASVWLVTALVPVGLLMINLLNPEWGRLLFQTGMGRVLLTITAFLVGIGYVTARRSSVVDV